MFYIEERGGMPNSGAIATSTLGDTDVVMLTHPGGSEKNRTLGVRRAAGQFFLAKRAEKTGVKK